jgi:hypothetical protein
MRALWWFIVATHYCLDNNPQARISGFHIDYEQCSGQLSPTSSRAAQ